MLLTLQFNVQQDPLEQFEVFNIFCRFFGNLEVFLYLVFFSVLFFLFSGYFGYYGYRQKKANIVFFRNILFNFILALIKENLRLKTVLFFPIVFYTFLFILFANLIGMVPYSFTVTSSAAVTFFFSISFFIGTLAIGLSIQRVNIFALFLPAGTPFFIMFFLIGIELISYGARLFSLAIRLFANMMSGHGLLKILGSFVWLIFMNFCAFDLTFLMLGLIIVFLVTFLEIVIAFLQAYVFMVLVCIYLNDVINAH
jgi:ATP synthase subunit 6